ncbi:MAG: TIGR01459 family HAD-type hydrolase [Porticoccaceae bacterium]|nr:TIGR01459 family HAD-type hydrolase [Porticoccaceae bacterium]
MPNAPTSSIPILSSIAPLAAGTVSWLVDIWGVMHNGVRPFEAACDACVRFRQEGGIVLLLSNSPRPREGVMQQLDRIGVPRASWDAIVTSGDVSRTLIAAYAGRAVVHLGPERDLPIFAGIDVERTGPDRAAAIVCTGLFDDERETPDDYAPVLKECLERGLPMVCANPDVMVERGGKLIYCAGAIARAYEAMGGSVAYAGKPFQPIYDLASETLETLRPGSSARSRLLAIGDGVNTDIAGAVQAGVRAVFVPSGVHMSSELSSGALEELFPVGAPRPVAAMRELAW